MEGLDAMSVSVNCYFDGEQNIFYYVTEENKMKGKTILNQVLVVSGVLSSLVSCGLGIGFLPQLQVGFYKTHQKSLDDKSQNNIESVGELAFMLSILIIPFAMEKMGRKVANIVTVSPSIFSWIMCFKSANFFSLVTVSALRNISLGGAVTISNIIISEFCGPKYRATFFIAETAAITLGVLLCHVCVVYSCSRVIPLLGVVSAAYGLIVSNFWLESPYWLVSKGRLDEGANAFYSLRGKGADVLKELNNLLAKREIKEQLKSLKPIKSVRLRKKITKYLKYLLNRDFFKPISIGLVILSLVGVGSENTISSFSLINIFKMNGKYIGTIILDILTLICSLTACALIQVVKRRSLFILIMAFSIVTLGSTSIVLFLRTKESISKEYLWHFPSLVTGIVMFMSLGTAVLPLSIMNEIFPMSYKGIGSSLTCTYFCGFCKSILGLVPSLISMFGFHGLIFVMTIAISVVILVFVRFIVEDDAHLLLYTESLVFLREDEENHVIKENIYQRTQINNNNKIFIDV